MPIKSKPIDPARRVLAAKGRLASGSAAYAEEQARSMEERRRWEAEEQAADGDASDASSSSAAAPSPKLPQPNATSDARPGQGGESDDEAAALAAAQARTRRFLSAGNATAKPTRVLPPSVERLVLYEAAKRRAAFNMAGEDDDPPEHVSSPPLVTPATSAPPPPRPVKAAGKSAPAAAVTVQEVLDGMNHPPSKPIGAAPSAKAAAAPASKPGDPLEGQFARLLELLADDVAAERKAAADAASAPATAGPDPSAKVTAGDGAVRSYRPPARTFAHLQAEALQHLYDEWGSAAEAEGRGVFMATDHEAAAFALAVVAESCHPVSDAPMSFEELATAQATARNATRRDPAGGPASDAGYSFMSAKGIALDAGGRLSRFLQSVAWTERLIRDPAFVATVAGFLHDNHKAFLSHYAVGCTSPGRSRAEREARIVEHTHAEHAVYEEFGRRVSAALLGLLADSVAGFDEEEFVESLFDSPDDAYSPDSGGPAGAGPQHVLSYPAWRIILGMSSFESFFGWVMDYVQEEYRLGRDPLKEQAVVAVGGTRGLRALMRTTYRQSFGSDLGTPRGDNADGPSGEDRESGGNVEVGAAPLSSLPGPADDRATAAAATFGTASPPLVALGRPSSVERFGSGSPTGRLPVPRPSSQPVPGAAHPQGGPGLNEQHLSHLRHSGRLFVSPPPSASLSSLSGRPPGIRTAKKSSAVAARDLPPIEGTPPAQSPLLSPDGSGSALPPAKTRGQTDRSASAKRGAVPRRKSATAPSRSGSRTSPAAAISQPTTTPVAARLATRSAGTGPAPAAKAGGVKPRVKRAV